MFWTLLLVAGVAAMAALWIKRNRLCLRNPTRRAPGLGRYLCRAGVIL